MKTILIPTDFSEQSLNAIDAGHQLAKITGCSLILLNVIEIGKGYLSASGEEIEPGEDEHQFLINAKKQIKQKLEELCYQIKNVDATYAVKMGDPYVNINHLIEEHQVDLVLMGSKGASGIKEFLIGSTCEKVVRYSRVPVLTIKEKIDLNSVKKIVLAIDPDEKQVNLDKVLEDIKAFQSMFNAELILLVVNTPASQKSIVKLNTKLRELIEQHQLENITQHIYEAETLEDGILYFSSEQNADIISLQTHNRVGIARIFAGSVSEGLVNHAKRPILTFNLKD